MESFLPMLIVDIANSAAESLVSCPQIMRESGCQQHLASNPDDKRSRYEGDTGLCISSRMKNTISSLRDI